jgi:hypothetical protein
LLFKFAGISNICKPPMSDVTIVYSKIGLRSGIVILVYVWKDVAPSI